MKANLLAFNGGWKNLLLKKPLRSPQLQYYDPTQICITTRDPHFTSSAMQSSAEVTMGTNAATGDDLVPLLCDCSYACSPFTLRWE